jgi:hypothetical protein
MAKHDQRILKFLTQNAERAPTITDMMTRLNISISDISDSLNSLLSQGLISKRTNGQGIECWFPLNGSPQPMAPAENRPVDMNRRSSDAERRPDESRILAGLNHPSPPEPSPLPPLQPTLPSLSASTAFPASLTAPAPAPQLSPRPAGRESAVFTATPAAGAAPAPGAAAPAPAAAVSTPPAGAAPAQPGLESLPGVPAPVSYNLAPVKTGVGFLTFAAGLILAAGAAVYFSGRLVKRDLETASRNFAEKPALDKALASMTAFESSAKLQLSALDTQVKELKARVDSLKSANDSLMAVAESARKAEAPPKKAVTKRRR